MTDSIPQLDRQGLRRFAITTGLLVGGIFGLLIPWVFDLAWPLSPWVIATLLVLWGLVLPDSVVYFYRSWMRLALILNKVTSPLVMGGVFYLVVLPTGLIMRWVARRDPMRRRLDHEQQSYRETYKATEGSDLRRPF